MTKEQIREKQKQICETMLENMKEVSKLNEMLSEMNDIDFSDWSTDMVLLMETHDHSNKEQGDHSDCAVFLGGTGDREGIGGLIITFLLVDKQMKEMTPELISAILSASQEEVDELRESAEDAF
jgi:hypothetical protein